MSALLDCLRIDNWQSFLEDSLPSPQRDWLEQHLERCSTCQERLERSRERDAALCRLGRLLGDPTALPADPTLVSFLDKVRDGKTLLRSAAVDPMEFLPLCPTERPDALGALGGLEILEVIGQGGMGVVLKAFDPGLNRVVAVKVMAACLSASANARRRFTREAKAAAAISHEHVVPVHGVHEVDGLPYLVMQYVPGESLQDRLDRSGALQIEEVVSIGLQTARGLAAAHAQGLIHRDIKPANILLQISDCRLQIADLPDGSSDQSGICNLQSAICKITDFGLARMIDDVGLTRDGVVAGTPEYMAPEQARGELVDHRADLFSLGSVLYAMSTGHSPFRGPNPVAILRRVSDDEPVPICSLNADVPAWLEAIIARLMAKKPADRLQSAAEVADLLGGCLTHLRQPTTVGAPVFSRTEKIPLQRCDNGPRSVFVRKWLFTRCLVALTILTVMGLGAHLGLFGQAGPEVQPAKNSDEQRLSNRITFSFRNGIDNLAPCTLFGSDADVLISSDAQGLRINRPADHPSNDDIGVEVPIWLRGDFDISFAYELLVLGRPTPDGGIGIVLRVMFGDPVVSTAHFSRTRKPNGEQFGTFRVQQDADGKDQFLEGQNPRAREPKGRMRLMRTGSELHFFAAEGGADYRELRSLEIGTEDVRLIRVFALTQKRPLPIDVRVSDLDIRADPIVSSVSAPAFVSPLAGLEAYLGAALLCALASALGVWLYIRRASPTISVQCPGCQKILRAEPALAGKKVKCPQCGEGVVVPSIVAG